MAGTTHVASASRPGVMVFRNRLRRHERFRCVAGFAAAALLLQGLALLIRWWPSLSEAARDEYAPLPQIMSFLPAFMALLVWIVPQYALGISPRGVWQVNTRWGGIPGTHRRWRVRWDEITQLRWRGQRSEFRVGSRRRAIAFRCAKPETAEVLKSALSARLGRRFDLTQGTVDEQLRRRWKAWSWRRWLLDKLELTLIGCAMLALFATMGYWYGHVLIPTIGLVAFLGAASVVLAHCVHDSQFGWQWPCDERLPDGGAGRVHQVVI